MFNVGYLLSRVGSLSCNIDPDHIALVFEDRRWSYRELNESTNRIANKFEELGIKKGDRVAVLLYNCAEYWEVLLFVLGIGLVIVEIFIMPGTGIPGILGVLSILTGLFFAGQPFIIPETEFQSTFLLRNLSSLIFSVLGALIAFYFVAKFLPKVTIFRNLILAGVEHEEVHASAVEIKRNELVGAIGVAMSDMRPVGKVQIGDELRDAQVKGFDYLEKGEKIVVIETSGNRIIVKP